MAGHVLVEKDLKAVYVLAGIFLFLSFLKISYRAYFDCSNLNKGGLGSSECYFLNFDMQIFIYVRYTAFATVSYLCMFVVLSFSLRERL